MVSLSDRVTVPAHVLIRFLDKEAVILNIETELYFGLDETGTRMWQLVTAAPNVATAYRQLLDEYDVQDEQLRQDLVELLGRLAENGLIQVASCDEGKTAAI